MFYTKHANTPGIAIFLDFRKAFDTIEWNYLLSALKLFNFGPDIQRWIEVIYHNVSSCVLNNGHASPFFQLHRGVRQGCPLSGLLFVIGIELLARALQNDNSIKGVNVNKKEIKVSQFADDTTVFVSDQDSVSNLLKLLCKFKHASGLEINTTKTEAMWLGAWRNREDTPYNFKWPQEPIRALGVFFAYNSDDADNLNFGEKIRKLEKTLNSWKRRKLTLHGRIKIVKTLGLSKLIYNTSVLVIPEHYVKEINNLTFNFIWEGKPAKIKKKTIISDIKRGGLKMLDFEIMDKALKIAWIKRLTDHNDAAWKIIPEFAATDYGGLSFLIECQYDVKYLFLDNLPPFYHTLLKYWQEYNHDKFLENSDIQNKIIWNNSRILIGGRPIFYKPLFQAQILSIKHLLSENNTFLSFDELKQKVNINIPFTLYYGLITSIPTEWKKLLRNQNNCSQSVISTPVPLHDPPSTRTAYSFLLDKAISPPTSEIRILNHGFTKENIHKVYTFPFSITKDSKLIAFQYNITHHILPTNSSLFRAGITESDTCTLCKSEKQTISHLLFHCTESSAFWQEFTSWWLLKFKQVITLTECVVLYGYHDNIKNKQALNVTLLLAKYHIFATSSCVGKLSFESFLLRLQNHLEILKQSYTAANKSRQFVSIYGNLL